MSSSEPEYNGFILSPCVTLLDDTEENANMIQVFLLLLGPNGSRKAHIMWKKCIEFTKN